MVHVEASILDRDDRIRDAICVCGPQSRSGDERRDEITDIAQRTANVTQVSPNYV